MLLLLVHVVVVIISLCCCCLGFTDFGWHSLFKKRLVRNFGFSDGDVSSHYVS